MTQTASSLIALTAGGTGLIALAAGGTGGHLYPAMTLARALQDQGYRTLLLTDKRGVRFVENTTIPYRVIQSAPMHKGLMGKIKTALRLGTGYLQCQMLFLRDKPVAVVGFGGYPSFPPVIAAAHRHIPVILHEQNAILGRAQRLVQRYARKICLSFAQTRLIESIPSEKIVVTGLPLRPEILSIANHQYALPQTGEKFRILVTGGSLASALFSDIIPQAILTLPDDIQQRIHITQQCRVDDVERVKNLYQSHNISADVLSYIHDMAEQLSSAHLMIGRAGASTVTENTLAGVPAIYVPLAVSLDGDQAANAAQIVAQDGAWMIAEKDFSPQALSAMLSDIINEPARLTAMASNLKTLGRADATTRLTSIILDAIS
jgi:UDP-N-acetylglucosamine--N-acetylmuramyl-(pentapeptide) pyrophosphoryl-undecaprenol N-acetylglucosamine transferase